jgi:hypothetical protein
MEAQFLSWWVASVTGPPRVICLHSQGWLPHNTEAKASVRMSGMFKGNCPYASQRQWVTHRFFLPALYTCCLCLSFDETCVEFSTFGREYIVYCAYESLILCPNYMLPNQTDYSFVHRARHERKKYIERKRDYLGRNRWYGKWSRYIIVCSPKWSNLTMRRMLSHH